MSWNKPSGVACHATSASAHRRSISSRCSKPQCSTSSAQTRSWQRRRSYRARTDERSAHSCSTTPARLPAEQKTARGPIAPLLVGCRWRQGPAPHTCCGCKRASKPLLPSRLTCPEVPNHLPLTDRWLWLAVVCPTHLRRSQRVILRGTPLSRRLSRVAARAGGQEPGLTAACGPAAFAPGRWAPLR